MKYLNQLEYPSIPYPTDISHPGSPLNSGSVKEAGCGLCCLAMAVDRLTDQSVSLKKLVSLSVKHKANLLPGTDMEILGPVVGQAVSSGIFHHRKRPHRCPLSEAGRLRHCQCRRRQGGVHGSVRP